MLEVLSMPSASQCRLSLVGLLLYQVHSFQAPIIQIARKSQPLQMSNDLISGGPHVENVLFIECGK